METIGIQLEPGAARALYNQYREHRHYSTAIDREIQRAYRLIAQGKVVIRALESIRAAGVGQDGHPKLAIGRADLPQCELVHRNDGSATMADAWRSRSQDRIFEFPAGSFPPPKIRESWRSLAALTPTIPLHLRPKTALANYHILWEAEWRRVVPRDPLLLRRIGHADLWLVVAAWDLTDVEYAALSTRVSS